MNEPLHPSTLSEILDRTAQLYRARFLLFLGISIIPTGVVLVLTCVVALVVAWWSAAGARSVSSETGFVLVAVFCIAAALVALPILLAAKALATAAMNLAASRVHMGETTTIRNAYKSVWKRGWRYIWLCFLQVLFVWVIPIAAWVALILLYAGMAALGRRAGMGQSSAELSGVFAFLFLAALAGYGIWMLLRLSLAFPACVVEQLTAWKSLKRSSVLSKGTRGRVSLLYLLGAALGWLLSLGVMVFLTILLYLIPGMDSPQHAQTAGVILLFIVYGSCYAVQTLIKPVYGIALTLIYYDQRIRKEGYDIEWMMQQAGMVPAQPPAPVQAPTAVPEAEQKPAPWLPDAPRESQPVVIEPPQPGEPA
jgi:hypothetical protein